MKQTFINPKYLFYMSFISLVSVLTPSLNHIQKALAQSEPLGAIFVPWAGATGIESGFILLGIAVNFVAMIPKIEDVLDKVGITKREMKFYYFALFITSLIGNIYAGFLNSHPSGIMGYIRVFFTGSIIPLLAMLFIRIQTIFYAAWQNHTENTRNIRDTEKYIAQEKSKWLVKLFLKLGWINFDNIITQVKRDTVKELKDSNKEVIEVAPEKISQAASNTRRSKKKKSTNRQTISPKITESTDETSDVSESWSPVVEERIPSQVTTLLDKPPRTRGRSDRVNQRRRR
jgi:hypothetical protein